MSNSHALRRLLRAATAVVIGGVVSVGFVASAATAAALPDLKVTIAVTPVKATYAVGDAVTTTFTLVNVGTATARNARIEGGDEDGLDRKTDPPSDQFDLAPGASRTIGWDAVVNEAAAVQGFANGGWSVTNDAGEANDADNTGTFHIDVPGETGHLHAKVFVDVKKNMDESQPGLAGADVIITDGKGKIAGRARTAADGTFTVTLPAGVYLMSVAGWTLEGENAGNAQVLGGQTAELVLPLVAGSGITTAPSGTVHRHRFP